jgi:hypothetical protein
VDTIRHPGELPSDRDLPPPATGDALDPGPGGSRPADLGPVSTVGTVAPSADRVGRSSPPVVNPPLVALALTVLFLLVLLVAVLLGPDGDRAGADEQVRSPAPAVDALDGFPAAR